MGHGHFQENVIFKPKFLFLGKITKMITRVNFWIATNSPFMYFLKFFTLKASIGMENFRQLTKLIYRVNSLKSGNSP